MIFAEGAAEGSASPRNGKETDSSTSLRFAQNDNTKYGLWAERTVQRPVPTFLIPNSQFLIPNS